MHSPTAVRMMVEPIDRQRRIPDMADDGCVDKDEGRFGDELAEGRQGQRHDPAVGGAGVGRAVADVCVCAGMRGAEAIAACSIAGTGGFGVGRVYGHAHTHITPDCVAQAPDVGAECYPQTIHQVIPSMWIT